MIIASFSLFSQQKTLDSIKETPKEVRTIDPRFKENYLGEDYIYEYSPNFWDNFKNWIISVLESWFNTSEKSANNIFENLETTFYILVISLVIYLIVKMLLNKEGRWIFGKKKSSKGIIYADVETNIIEINFEELIENAIENENFRLAIRYSYLWILKQLDEKSIIEYNSEKTNVDYQYEVENSAFSEKFKTASYYYNYVWYGEFFIDKEAYSKAAELYKNFLNQIENVK
jgi:hypothetical protein